MFNIRNMGIETPHDNTFEILRPFGMGVCVFLLTMDPCVVSVDPNPYYKLPCHNLGKNHPNIDAEFVPHCGYELHDMQPGECILYTDTFPRILTIPKYVNDLRNSWIHFSCEDASTLFSQLGIMPNTILSLRDPELIASILYDIMSEHLQMNAHWKRMENSMFEMLLINVARCALPAGSSLTSREIKRRESLAQLRKKMYLNPARDWSVASMAESMFMSVNRFIDAYSEYFGITPKQDIINARVQHAKTLLGLQNVSLRDAATLSGFQSEYYFSSVFKRITGYTPAAFRRQISSISEL